MHTIYIPKLILYRVYVIMFNKLLKRLFTNFHRITF